MVRDHPSLLASSPSDDDDTNNGIGGQTYEELVNKNYRESSSNNVGGMDESGYDLSIESDESASPTNFHSQTHHKGRQSIGFMLGRNSLSNWTTIGGAGDEGHEEDDGDEEEMEDIGQLNTGRKSNVTGRKSSMETPLMGQLINVSSRRSTHQFSAAAAAAAAAASNGRGGNSNVAHSRGRRSTNPLNISHISSSSSSNGFDDSMSLMKDSWSPIRASLDNSFAADASRRASRSLSPRRRSRSPPTRRGSFSSSKSPTRSSSSPTRSPLEDISPNRHHQRSTSFSSFQQKKSPVKSPNGTFSLKEASPSVSVQQQQKQQQQLTSPTDKKTGGVKSIGGNGGGRKSLSFPSLASTRKSIGFSPAVKPAGDNAGATIASSNDGATATTTTSTIRSPIPTPNSQRRLVKRFRASVPTANYMDAEEIEKETTTKDSNEGSSSSSSSSGDAVALLRRFETTYSSSQGGTKHRQQQQQQQQQQQEYKNDFVFPESIPVPSAETLLLAHNQAISVGSPSHQYQLTRAGTNLLSLQEVILPSILTQTSSVLKEKQAKAQRNVKDGMPDHQGKDVVEVIEACRKLVNRCIGEAMKEAGDSWRQREERRTQSRMERHLAQVEQRKANERQAKRQRKEQRALSREMRYESAKREMQLNHPRNKAMWTEVVTLDNEIQKLKREERKWMQVKKELDSMGDPNNERMELDHIVPSSSVEEQVANIPLEHTARTMVEDVTMAMNRLNWMLSSVSSAMEESDKLRKEAFTKYSEDHKMIGFSQFDDPKDLFRRITRKSIGGTPVRGGGGSLVC
ncbi:hypothetical protein ACHAXM_005350 [Skeletonema potamos]